MLRAHSSHIASDPLRLSARRIALALLALGALEGSRLFVTHGALGRGLSLFDALGSGLMDAASWLPLLPFVLWALRRFPWPHPGALACVTIHLLVGVALAAAQGVVFAAFTTLVRELRFGEGQFARELVSSIHFKLQASFLLYVVVTFAVQALREQRRRGELHRLLAETRLAALQSRLQPHFLFNSLHVATSLISRDPRGAERVLEMLSDLLRAVLHFAEKASIPLRDEIDLLESYLRIQQVRFGERLRVHLDVAADSLGIHVPPLLLQPLAENAIQHGLSTRAEGTLSVHARLESRRLLLTLEDDGTGLGETSDAAGLGLANTRARLEALYEDATLDLERRESGGVRVRLNLPARNAEGERR